MGLYYNCKKKKAHSIEIQRFYISGLNKKIFFTGFPFLCPMVNAS